MEIQVPTEGGFAERIRTALGDGGGAPVSWENLAEVMGCVVDASRLQKTLAAKRDERIAALEAKVLRLEAALEVRGGLKYVGVFKEGRVYDADQFATHAGSVWHCNARTMTMPGNGSAAWTLAIKCGERGRDGKDAGK